MESNINPALVTTDHSHISAEEFQKQFCEWLEEKGVLSELRIYFRTNMIELLKNTTVGYSVKSKIPYVISPKMHAVHLLISEFLLNYQHNFSLCVFCTEVSLKNIFSKVNENGETETKTWKFLQNDLYEILQSLGIHRDSKFAHNISIKYYGNSNTLLECLICINVIDFLNIVEPINDIEFDNIYKFVTKNIENLINRTVSSEHISKIKSYIKWMYNEERENIYKVKQEEIDECKKQLIKYKNKLFNMQNNFEKQRLELENEIRDLKCIVQSKIAEKKNSKYEREKKDKITVLEVDSKKETKLIDAQKQNSILTDLVQKLQDENNNLKCLNRNYLDQIEELGDRAVILMKELDNSQEKIARLNGFIENSETPRKQGIVSFTGAGEESGQSRSYLYKQRNYRNFTREKKKCARDKSSHTASSCESSELTDYVLQEAKNKLKNLELESDKIDKHFTYNGDYPVIKACYVHNLAENSDSNKNLHINNECETEICNARDLFQFRTNKYSSNKYRSHNKLEEKTLMKKQTSGQRLSFNKFSFLDNFDINTALDVCLNRQSKTISNQSLSSQSSSACEKEAIHLDVD